MKLIKLAKKGTKERPVALVSQRIESALGELQITASLEGIIAVDWVDESLQDPINPMVSGCSDVDSDGSTVARAAAWEWARRAVEEIQEFMAQTRRDFSVPVVVSGTDFQMNVWEALSNIPYGETRTYRDIAKQIGVEKAVRAVGQANRRNPVPVLLPCHRVIGTNGSLVGYAGSKVDLKERLLRLEGYSSG